MDFSSDTSAPAHLSVIEALTKANSGMAASYGDDEITSRVRAQLCELFECDLEIWMCSSGTASNALALSLICPPTGAILCHEEAHIERDERGAPEFYTGGGRLHLLPGAAGQIDEDALKAALGVIDRGFVHETPPYALSLTTLTECGTAYSFETITRYASLAHEAGLKVHLDGARIANALAWSGDSLADMTWRAGVDVLSFGLTKTGAMGCEIIILFGEMREELFELKTRAKRAGHMPAKMRFIAAQAEALLKDDLWLKLAGKANVRAATLAAAFDNIPGAKLAYPVEGNEVFVHLPEDVTERLQRAGAKFYPWPGGSHRFVCSWTTSEGDIAALASHL